MPRCSICNKYIKSYNSSELCKRCRAYLKDNALFDKDYTIGCQKVLANGKKVCKMCGKAYFNLATHIAKSHNFTIEDYIKEFELNYNKHIYDNRRERSPNTVSEDGRKVLQNNMNNARAVHLEKCRKIKESGGKVTRKHKPTHNVSEKDRERRRLAMILINQNRKNKKNS